MADDEKGNGDATVTKRAKKPNSPMAVVVVREDGSLTTLNDGFRSLNEARVWVKSNVIGGELGIDKTYQVIRILSVMDPKLKTTVVM